MVSGCSGFRLPGFSGSCDLGFLAFRFLGFWIVDFLGVILWVPFLWSVLGVMGALCELVFYYLL